MNFRFQNRAQAGRFLAEKLAAYASRPDVVILGLPRGGIPVAFEVARRLQRPLHAFLVRKLGVPGQEELAMGAIASGGVCFLNARVVESLRISRQTIDKIVARERQELERCAQAFCAAPMAELRGQVVILIDDGLATGASMRAAVIAVREHHPAQIIVAVPVAALEIYQEFGREVDEIICVQAPKRLEGVGQWYEDFSQTSDEEVRGLLAQGLGRGGFGAQVTMPGNVPLEGDLVLPAGAQGVVLFAHGSGSSRHSPRNQFVAAALREANLGTLLFDLLSADEEVIDLQTTHLRFDIALLAKRLIQAVDWMSRQEPEMPLGLFGASTGAGAALLAAAQRPGLVGAVVSRGGRPDLAGPALRQVQSPTLLIVGERDKQVMALNRLALDEMPCEKKMEIVPRATHLFEEPGALEEVGRLARNWFGAHLAVTPAPERPAMISEGL